MHWSRTFSAKISGRWRRRRGTNYFGIGSVSLSGESPTRSARAAPTVANMLRLLSLPPSVRRLLEEGRLSMGHGRAILAVEDPVRAAELAREGRSGRLVGTEDRKEDPRGAGERARDRDAAEWRRAEGGPCRRRPGGGHGRPFGGAGRHSMEGQGDGCDQDRIQRRPGAGAALRGRDRTGGLETRRIAVRGSRTSSGHCSPL